MCVHAAPAYCSKVLKSKTRIKAQVYAWNLNWANCDFLYVRRSWFTQNNLSVISPELEENFNWQRVPKRANLVCLTRRIFRVVKFVKMHIMQHIHRVNAHILGSMRSGSQDRVVHINTTWPGGQAVVLRHTPDRLIVSLDLVLWKTKFNSLDCSEVAK